jgi:peptidyl-prolyl cis-trans isomerase C
MNGARMGAHGQPLRRPPRGRAQAGTRGVVASCCVALALGDLAACRRPLPPAPDVAARIGSEEVRYAEFASYLARAAGGSEGALASDVLSQLFDQFVEEKLLLRLAVDRGLVTTASRPRPAIDALLRQGLGADPGAAEIAAFYQAHRAEFARPERVRLRQILTASRAAAERARRQVERGADFAAVARRLSHGPDAVLGGDQGELARTDLPPALVEVVFGLRAGEVSPVVPASYGFHLFQVTARLPAEVAPLDEVRAEVLARLRQQRADQLLRSLVRQGKARYNVQVYGRNLPFNYGGLYRDEPAADSR